MHSCLVKNFPTTENERNWTERIGIRHLFRFSGETRHSDTRYCYVFKLINIRKGSEPGTEESIITKYLMWNSTLGHVSLLCIQTDQYLIMFRTQYRGFECQLFQNGAITNIEINKVIWKPLSKKTLSLIRKILIWDFVDVYFLYYEEPLAIGKENVPLFKPIQPRCSILAWTICYYPEGHAQMVLPFLHARLG